MALALYSPEDVIILLGGIYQIEGLHEGSFISIEEDEDRWKTSVTTDGRVTRTHNKTATHTVSITLSSTADANSIFSAWAAADGFLYGAMLPLFIRDTNGTSMFYSPVTWVEKSPQASFDEGVTGREWVLKASGAVNTIGGNESGGVIPTELAVLGFIGADVAGFI